MRSRNATISPLMLMLALAGAVALPTASHAQAAPAPRPPIDVRTMAPGPLSPEAATPAPAASGLTRDQRKDATLRARQEGTLKPAGEAADLRDTAAITATRARATAAVTPPASPMPAAVPTPTTRTLTASAAPPSHAASAAHARSKKSGDKKIAALRARPATRTTIKAAPPSASRAASTGA